MQRPTTKDVELAAEDAKLVLIENLNLHLSFMLPGKSIVLLRDREGTLWSFCLPYTPKGGKSWPHSGKS